MAVNGVEGDVEAMRLQLQLNSIRMALKATPEALEEAKVSDGEKLVLPQECLKKALHERNVFNFMPFRLLDPLDPFGPFGLLVVRR